MSLAIMSILVKIPIMGPVVVVRTPATVQSGTLVTEASAMPLTSAIYEVLEASTITSSPLKPPLEPRSTKEPGEEWVEWDLWAW